MMSARSESTIIEMLSWATLELQGGSVINPRTEAEIIIAEITNLSKTELYLYANCTLASIGLEAADSIEKTIAERLKGRPLQYIVGHQQFRYLDILCREDVLIPRPETELLVEAVIDDLKTMDEDNIVDVCSAANKTSRVVVDIGCGTGAIGLSIAQEFGGAFVYMVDKSSHAIALATENALRNELHERTKIVESDMFGEIGYLGGAVDVVVSNPPYIRRDDLPLLQREVQFEPQMALDGGNDGLDYYRLIAEQAPCFLKSGGVMLLEVGFNQSADVKRILESTGLFIGIDTKNDYQAIERIVRAQRL